MKWFPVEHSWSLGGLIYWHHVKSQPLNVFSSIFFVFIHPLWSDFERYRLLTFFTLTAVCNALQSCTWCFLQTAFCTCAHYENSTTPVHFQLIVYSNLYVFSEVHVHCVRFHTLQNNCVKHHDSLFEYRYFWLWFKTINFNVYCMCCTCCFFFKWSKFCINWII